MKNIDKSVQITFIVMAGIIILGAMIVGIFNSAMGPQNTITGNGETTISVTPDLVTVYLTVETKNDSSEDAKNTNTRIIDSVVTKLISQGFDRDEIQTMNFNIYPNYDYSYGKRTENGFVVNHQLKIEFSTEQRDKIGKTIDAGIDAGAQVGSINFELSPEKQNEYKAQAIKLAAQDARAKAEAMAQGLGKELGDLVSVSDSNFRYSPWNVYSMGTADGMVLESAQVKSEITNIQPGEQDIYARVNAVFEIK